MLNETLVLKRLKRRLGVNYNMALTEEDYMDIVVEESLITFSTYYPYIIQGIKVHESDALPITNNDGVTNNCSLYTVSAEQGVQYIGLEYMYYPSNENNNFFLPNGGATLTESVAQKIKSYLPNSSIRFTGKFEFPNLIRIDPPPNMHQDFVVNMLRCRYLYEIQLGLRELFLKLVEYDVKIAIYNELKNVAEDGIYNGINVRSSISNYESAESDRDELLEKFEGDYYKNPERFEAIFNSQGGY